MSPSIDDEATNTMVTEKRRITMSFLFIILLLEENLGENGNYSIHIKNVLHTKINAYYVIDFFDIIFSNSFSNLSERTLEIRLIFI